MLIDWLSKNEHSEPYGYGVNDFHENEVNRQELLNYLDTLLIDSIVPKELVIKSINRYGWTATYSTLVEPSIPTGKQQDRMKKGRFGEALISEILVDHLGYYIPVKKLQYQITANKPLPSTDAIAFEMKEGMITKICYVESKVRTKRFRNPVIEAYLQLRKDLLKVIPDMERFVLNCLENSKDPLADTLLDIMMAHQSNNNSSELRIGVVCEASIWEEQHLISLNDEIKKNEKLYVDIIHLDNLQTLITQAYSQLNCVVIDDE